MENKEHDTYGVDRGIINAFHQQWENFPEFAALIRKDRRVIALNKAAREIGYPQGIRCAEVGGKELHKVCLADKALKQKAGMSTVISSNMPGAKAAMITYWVPLKDKDDLYVHLNIDISRLADMKKVNKHEGVMRMSYPQFVKISMNMFFKMFGKKFK